MIETQQVTAWIQYGAPGLLALVLYFVGRAGLKLLDRFAASLDKLDSTIAQLSSHVQAAAIAEAAALERRHAELLAAIAAAQTSTRHDIREIIAPLVIELSTLEERIKESR